MPSGFSVLAPSLGQRGAVFFRLRFPQIPSLPRSQDSESASVEPLGTIPAFFPPLPPHSDGCVRCPRTESRRGRVVVVGHTEWFVNVGAHIEIEPDLASIIINFLTPNQFAPCPPSGAVPQAAEPPPRMPGDGGGASAPSRSPPPPQKGQSTAAAAAVVYDPAFALGSMDWIGFDIDCTLVRYRATAPSAAAHSVMGEEGQRRRGSGREEGGARRPPTRPTPYALR